MIIKRPTSRQPIPQQAKVVFKGIMFDTYQWEQHMYDGSIKTFEKIKRKDTVNVLPVTANGEIILGEQEQPGSKPFIGCLGGAIDENEDPLEAAKRELLEETGMKADKHILWDAVQFIDKMDWVIYTFIAKNCFKVQDSNLDSGEKIKLMYVSFDKFLKVTEQENYRDSEIALKVFRAITNPKEL